MSRRAAIIVLDGLGIGQAHDADAYGDTGSDTLGNTLRAVGGPAAAAPRGARAGQLRRRWPACRRRSRRRRRGAPASRSGRARTPRRGTGKSAACRSSTPSRPIRAASRPKLVAEFASRTGRAVIGNKAASGTAILDELGEEHRRTGAWIVYTSADSVFQVAAHQDVVPLEELYAACQAARDLLRPPHGVSRVIARPFVGSPGAWTQDRPPEGFQLAAAGTDPARPPGRPPRAEARHRQGGRPVRRPEHRERARRHERRGIPPDLLGAGGDASGPDLREHPRIRPVVGAPQRRHRLPRRTARTRPGAPRHVGAGAGGGPRYLYRGPRERPDDTVHRPLA